MNAIVPDYQTPKRMAAKQAAFAFPHVRGKGVLDVGCDMAHWSFLAAQQGADFVLGLDRNRDVRGVGPVNLVELNRRRAKDEDRDDVHFEEINLGKQWREFGSFHVVLCLSMYHHWFEACGDHSTIWFWLSRHCTEQLIWEGPVDDSDPVVRSNVSEANRKNYTRDAILTAAAQYFDPEFVGPALHEPTREVWKFRPLAQIERATRARMVDGAGGATGAFEYERGRRIGEIEAAIGIRPVAGSLNLKLEGPFDWDRGCYRTQILDVVQRGKGLDVGWAPRWARFYPLTINDVPAFAFRFEGESYDGRFMELIADRRLRDEINGTRVTLCR